jgi:uncharacterized Zn finger protein
LLAVLLFCGTAWAGVCPLRCELRRDVPVTLQAVGDGAMAHCHGMAMEAVPGDAVSAGCAASLCGHAVASVAVAGERGAASQGVPEAAVVGMVLALSRRVRVVALVVERPPRSSAGFDPALVALRV